MAYRERDIKQLYWSIGEVADMFAVAPSAVRFWLQEFGIEIKKNRRGNRKFTAEDIERVRMIYTLCGGEDNKRLHLTYARYLIESGQAEKMAKYMETLEPKVKINGIESEQHAAD